MGCINQWTNQNCCLLLLLTSWNKDNFFPLQTKLLSQMPFQKLITNWVLRSFNCKLLWDAWYVESTNTRSMISRTRKTNKQTQMVSPFYFFYNRHFCRYTYSKVPSIIWNHSSYGIGNIPLWEYMNT